MFEPTADSNRYYQYVDDEEFNNMFGPILPSFSAISYFAVDSEESGIKYDSNRSYTNLNSLSSIKMVDEKF